MITMRRQFFGLGFMAASSILAFHAAQAMTAPTAITIDGGPLGPLELSGGVDGYGYYLSGTNPSLNPSGSFTNKADGIYVANALVELQKSAGIVQFTIEVGSNGGETTLGATPAQTSVTNFTTGPLYAGYITIAPPGTPITVSAGMLNSLEGYESPIDWNNAVQMTTAIFGVENSQSRGVEAAYTKGALTATVSVGDGYDTGVFNFLQALVTYQFNSNNTLNVYYGGNLGTTGVNADSYGQSGGHQNSVGFDGPQFANSQMIGAYYSYTTGNLNLVPEAQFQIAKAQARLGSSKPTSNFGAALFADYSFPKSPYSIGAWGEYFDSHSGVATTDGAGNVYANDQNWFIGPNAEAIGAAVAPTWQYKDLFARANAGYIYLLNNKDGYGDKFGYGDHGTGRGEFLGTLEAGVLF